MFGVYFKNQKGSVMKKVLSKIFVIFAFLLRKPMLNTR